MVHNHGESALAEKISDWEDNLPKLIKLAYLPSPGYIRLRLSYMEKDKNQLFENQYELLKSLVSEYIFSEDNIGLHAINI